ncbi:MAG: nucleotidyltransferase [Firmicutes bacterium]|nr:nucleotidyltransferase [Bacillota bacterium]
MTLVIMAAGMGSRFGGLKQIEPFGNDGEFILDFSIYDAIKAGFNKVVFIIKEENYDLFRDTVGKRIEDKIEVDYVFQKNDEIPEGYECPKDRVKPWGTGHAILACKDVVKESFLVLNADDFYGSDAFEVASSFLKQSKKANEMAMVGYQVVNTLTENGSVKRGVCEQKDGKLTRLIESNVEEINGIVNCKPLDGSLEFNVEAKSLVSMNMFVFTPLIFDILEHDIKDFFEKNKDNLEKCEFLIPDVVYNNILNGNITVDVLDTNAKWYGVTYKEDKESVLKAIKSMIEDKIYPEKLWK